MKMHRRDLLKFAVGSAAGILLTPVPWKVLDDTAIWTQNWPWIPVPRKGEATTRFTTCTLCPAGCGVRVRCIGGQPVSLAGVSDHPLSRGTLCPIGLGAHHLAYHPSRLVHPVRRVQKFGASESTPITIDQATDIIAGAIRSTAGEESVAVMDQQPGRSISLLYRRLFARLPHGLYLRAPMVEDATLAVCASMMGVGEGSLGFDLENARTIVSFGAPLFDGWGTPGRMMGLAESRRKHGRPSILQIETRQSRTALQADDWIPVKPGTDGVLALGLACVLVHEQLCDIRRLRSTASDFDCNDSFSFTELLARYTPETVSAATGVSADRIRSIARCMAAETPTVVLGAGDPAGGPLLPEENLAIASLNFLLGSVGRRGGVIGRGRTAPVPGNGAIALPPHQIQDVPDRSIRVLLLDGAESGHALPWALIERKLADEKALVVSFSPYAVGLSRHAEIVLPSPVFLESLQDAPAPFHSPVESFSLSAPLLTSPPETIEPVEVLKRIAAASGIATEMQDLSSSDHLKARVQELFASGRGSVFTPSDRRTVRVKELASFSTLWEALIAGGCWMGDPANPVPPSRFSFFGNSGVTAHQMLGLAEKPQVQRGIASPLALMPYGWRGAAGSGQVSPIMSKVYQESGLRSVSNHAFVNPETGKAHGLVENEPATVETQAGSIQVFIQYDPSVMPDVLHIAVGPDGTAINSGNAGDQSEVLSKCLTEDGRSWRVAAARVSRRTA